MTTQARAGIWLVACSMAAGFGCSDEESSPPGGGAGRDGTGGRAAVGLRKAALAAGKLVGTAVHARALRDDPEYAEILAREFDYVTHEDALKWGSVAPAEGSYAWGDADAILEYAEEHRQAVKGHTFVWHRQTPPWIHALGADALRAALKSHIETTLARYRGRIRAWDVVNEAVNTESASGYTESVFWQKLGPSYIEDAFRWARAADPDVLLFYNEVGIERMGPKSDFTYALLRDLLAKGVPIDGIGFQSHVSTHRYPAESNLRANIRRFADLGLKVNISEADARTLLMPGTRDSRWQAQRVAFQQIVGACVIEPDCESITFWGFTDKYSWINDEGEPDDPLLYDRDYAPKPAYEGALQGLAGLVPIRGDNLVPNGDFAAGDSGWSSQTGGLAVTAATDREGNAACVRGRTLESDGLSRSDLLQGLAEGGPLSFAAWVKLAGASSGTAQAALTITEEGREPRELSLATVPANDSTWVELAGYSGLGFSGTPTAIELTLYGPPAGVDLCVANVELRPLSAP